MEACTSGSSFSTLHAQLGGQREGFGEAFKNERNLQVHDQLRRLPFAGFAHVEYLLAHRLKKRLQPGQHSLVAAHHKNQAARSRRRSSSRSSERPHSRLPRFHSLGKSLRRGRRNRARVGNDHARAPATSPRRSAPNSTLSTAFVSETHIHTTSAPCAASAGEAARARAFHVLTAQCDSRPRLRVRL